MQLNKTKESDQLARFQAPAEVSDKGLGAGTGTDEIDICDSEALDHEFAVLSAHLGITPGAYAEGGSLESDYQNAQASANATSTSVHSSNGGLAEIALGSADHGLVTASPVDIGCQSNEVIGVADPVDLVSYNSRREEAKQKRQLVGMSSIVVTVTIILGLVLIVLFVVVGILDQGNDSNLRLSAPADIVGDKNDRRREDYVKRLLPDYTLVALSDPESPQSSAFHWIIADPLLLVDNYYHDWRIQQRFALATIYFATTTADIEASSGIGRSGWGNDEGWLSYTLHECDWAYTKQDYYAFVHMPEVPDKRNNLVQWYAQDLATFNEGPCGKSIRTDMYVKPINDEAKWNESYIGLRLSRNGLGSELPEELGLLSSLRSIDLSFNPLDGSLPSLAFTQLTSLESIEMASCGLTGPIPSGLFDTNASAFLRNIQLLANNMTGTLPPSLVHLSNLQFLMLGGNTIGGSLPRELGKLSSLAYLNAESCHLSGTLPTEIGLLSSSLVALALRKNALEGSLPSELGHASRLFYLSVASNQFSSSLPSQLGNLSFMGAFYALNNSFSGSILSELGRWDSLGTMDLSDNSLSGSVPREFLSFAKTLLQLNFANNTLLSGTIPDELCPVPDFDCTQLLCGCDCPCP